MCEKRQALGTSYYSTLIETIPNIWNGTMTLMQMVTFIVVVVFYFNALTLLAE